MTCADEEPPIELTPEASRLIDNANKRVEMYFETIVRRDSEIASLQRRIRTLEDQLNKRQTQLDQQHA